MSEFFLRVEGVNFDHFLEDTRDLSTIRGGGLLLLDAVREIEHPFGLEPISLGASVGLFRFAADDRERAAERRTKVERFFADHENLRHATFVVDAIAATGDFVRDLETLKTLNRWRQLTSPSLAVPSPAGEKAKPCGLSRVLPASNEHRGPSEKETPLSESVFRRRQYGQSQKQKLYERLTGRPWPMGFSKSFEELTHHPGAGSLDAKMAVFHTDGNGFGRIQRELCKAPEQLQAFDSTTRGYREIFLSQLLDVAEKDPSFREQSKPRAIRLETLRWGGDEMIWVAPAWLGFRLAALFMEASAAWHYGERPLLYSGGLVFCNHRAPIHRLVRRAEELTGLAKEAGRDRRRLAYEVFESFDDTGRDLREYRRQRRPSGLFETDVILLGDGLSAGAEAFARLRPHLPTRRVYGIVRALLRGEPEAEQQIAQLHALVPPEAAGDLAMLESALGGGEAMWLHLGQLWDYLAPEVGSHPASATEEEEGNDD